MTVKIGNLFPGELKPDTTVAGCIDIFENVWPDPLGTIAKVEDESGKKDSGMNWVRATTLGQGTNQNYRTNYHLGITVSAWQDNNLLAQNIHNQMYLLLLAATTPYAQKHNIPYLFHEDYQMLRYSGGQHYKAHSDGNTDSGRTVSAIIYLNDDYVGGEIEFVNFGIKIKPQRGMLILFPSNYAYSHIAHPVTEGTKYALVTWIKDREICQ